MQCCPEKGLEQGLINHSWELVWVAELTVWRACEGRVGKDVIDLHTHGASAMCQVSAATGVGVVLSQATHCHGRVDSCASAFTAKPEHSQCAIAHALRWRPHLPCFSKTVFFGCTPASPTQTRINRVLINADPAHWGTHNDHTDIHMPLTVLSASPVPAATASGCCPQPHSGCWRWRPR